MDLTGLISASAHWNRGGRGSGKKLQRCTVYLETWLVKQIEMMTSVASNEGGLKAVAGKS